MDAGGVGRLALSHPLTALDRRAPWYGHLHALAVACTAAVPVLALNAVGRDRGLSNAAGLRLRFVPADDAGTAAYEAHIAATGRVPTRSAGAGALHDLFNALVWLTLPATKAALNARQAQEIARAGVGAVRGAVRDACTLIDESGLVLACADTETYGAVKQALATRDWLGLFVEQRAQWHARIAPVVIGHALLEKLARPYKGISAQVIVLDCHGGHGDLLHVDRRAADFVQRADLATSVLAPLPVLGIPGWCPDNEERAFYADSRVFRPRPVQRSPIVSA
ncbi:MAG: DUF3025 domain-containing protein [Betaproteobacteria bacterium]